MPASTITDFSWTYTSDPDYPNPVGYSLHIATDSTMLEYEEYFLQGSVGENSFSRAGFLDFDTIYFWQVIPFFGGNGPTPIRNFQRGKQDRDSTPSCPIWSFRTEATPSLAAPQNVQIERFGPYLKLSWLAVQDASEYMIYASDDPKLPLTEWELINAVSVLYCYTSLTQSKRFYYLKACN